jgi:hypothetical protein
MRFNHHFRHISHTLVGTATLFFTATTLAGSPWSEDLQHFRSEVFEADASYSGTERLQAEGLLSQLEADFEDMSHPEIELALAEVSATSDNGHSFLMPGGWTHRYPRLPLHFRVFSDGTYVISATDEFKQLVGHRLTGIEGHSLEELREAWTKYQGGQVGWRNLYLPYFLETPAMLHAAGLVEGVDSVVLSLADAEGAQMETEIPASSDLPQLEGMDQYLAPSRLLVVANQMEQPKLPLYLQSPGQAFRFKMLENPKTAYVQFKANIDFTGSQDIDAFQDSVSGALRTAQPQFIILDQRFNFGGDLNVTRELIQSLPDFLSVGGKIYIITSGRTFSAGISSVGYLKQVAGDQAVIVGEPIGDALEFWAEGDLQVLPNSGVAFLMATERHNYVTGCPEDDCHGSIQRHPIQVDSLQPDIAAPLQYSDFEQGLDPAMIAIQEHILREQ